MATVHADPHVASHLAHQRRLQECLHALNKRGWEQRWQPLATHMIEKRLVRARGDAGAPLRHLGLEVLRPVLSRLLSQDGDGYLIYQLVVEGAEPAQVAAEQRATDNARTLVCHPDALSPRTAPIRRANARSAPTTAT